MQGKRGVVLALAIPMALLVGIQLPPTWLWQTNPPVVAEPPWDSPDTRALAKRACFDCHSNETVWPIWGRIAPASWLVTRDTLQGREELNFSEWGVSVRRGDAGGGEGEGGDDAAQKVADGEMPPSVYLLMHPSARLSTEEKDQLIIGLQQSLR